MPTSSYTFKVLLEGKDAIAAAKRIRAELQRELSQGVDLRRQMADIGTQAQTTAQRMALMEQELHQTAQEGEQLTVDLRHADDATRSLVTGFYQGEISARQLEQALRGDAQVAEDLRQKVQWLGRDLQQVAQMGRFERFGAAMTAAARETYGMRTLAAGLGRVGTGMMATGAAIIGPLTMAGRSYLEFADDANRAARQLKLNADLTEHLKDETLDLSASLGLFTPEEISQGLYTWASALGAVAESQEDFNELLEDSTEIQKLAAMNQEQLGTTTEFVAAILGEFGMDTSQVNRTVSVLNYTADRTQATVGDLGQAFKYLGPVAADLGEDIEGVAAAMGVAADAGIKGSMSGRALRQLFIRLVKPTSEMNDAFNEALGLSGELGQTWQEIAFPEGKFIGLANFIDLVAAATEDMTDQQRQALLAQMATANELPTLTALVTRQIDAREQGINVLRAEEKIMTGVIDAEVRKYGEWKEATEGITVSLESARDAWEREWQMYEDSDVARADRIQKRWDAAWKRIGEAAVETGLPMVEKLADGLDRISRHIEEHPEAVGKALQTGAFLAGVGALVKVTTSGIRLYTDAKMITAAATMYQASTNMLEAAGIQAASNKNLLGGMGGLVGSLALIAAALTAEKYIVEKAGIPDWMQTQMARGTESYEEYVRASQEITQGRLEILTRAQWEAVHAGQELRDVLEEIGDQGTIVTHDIADELRDWNVELTRARRSVQGLGSDLMQLPTDTGVGLAAFTEEQLKAIDQIVDYQRERNELVEQQNEELLKLEEDLLAEQADYYQEYLDERAELEQELQTVVQDPLWQTTEEVQESLEQQREAYEEYNHDVEEAIEDHQRKLRDLQEDHGAKMLDLEAARDARGLIEENRTYDQAVRDAGEQHEDLLEDLEERLDETIEQEVETIAKLREERQADLELQLQELDQNYQEEAQMRQEEFDKKYRETEEQNRKELTQLENAHAERLATIMGWEERVRDALRQGYIGREQDLADHLSAMEHLYLESYDIISQATMALPETPDELRDWNVEFDRLRQHNLQIGGYASSGVYRLGEAGREFVLSAPTTQVLERAIGHLSQAKITGLAAGGGRLDLVADIYVRADPVFGPEFAAQIRSDVRGEIVGLIKKVTDSQPGAYRTH